MGTEKIRIKLKYKGIEAEIECTEEQIRKAVEEFLSAFQTMTVSEEALKLKEPIEPLPTTCRGVVLSLWREGWFSEGRTLGETHEEMGKRGFHYDRTAVAHTLADLVRRGILYRDGRKGKYVYYQKRPINK